MLNGKNVIALRMRRQYMGEKASEEEYETLFRDLSPVPTVYWCCPGEPPVLSERASFDDRLFNTRRRARREILKGRFQGGTIGYVDRQDLSLYGSIYRKAPKAFTQVQEELLALLRREGPMNIGLMKELTGLLVKEITPALHKLQEAFLVFEDQADNEWDRAWYLMEGEFPELNLALNRGEAIEAAVLRFAYRIVAFDLPMAKSFFRLPVRDLKAALDGLLAQGALVSCPVDGEGVRLLLREDVALLESEAFSIEPSALALHRNDFLVKAMEQALKERFDRPDWEVLQYLLIDGSFQGAVYGKFKNGPFLVEDVWAEESVRHRKEELLRAAKEANPAPESLPKRYCGEELKEG
ncbi:hypothetical protein [Fumia xinanensis]|uniref:Uncharacterized protein n=1 Tax=Fumia xinanensis TaxID=2763659 RepID=A0A926E6Z5_9FIRM|nr:hypothetical protein [Fumia xinanensis]MBC8560321.1 hypothetical protein [Fumia xinanensis]